MGGCASMPSTTLANVGGDAPLPPRSSPEAYLATNDGITRQQVAHDDAATLLMKHTNAHEKATSRAPATSSFATSVQPLCAPLIVAKPTLPPSLLYAIPGYSANAEVNQATHGIVFLASPQPHVSTLWQTQRSRQSNSTP
jgi:hypothetical protein